jgi:hypothetical protein
MVDTMRSFRSFLLTLGGLTFVAVVAVFTASLMLAAVGTVSVLIAGTWLSAVLTNKPAPVRAYARARTRREQDQLRVWNDGKGTIIDM